MISDSEKETHERLIAKIMATPRTPEEYAAKNEITTLRAKIARLEHEATRSLQDAKRTSKSKE